MENRLKISLPQQVRFEDALAKITRFVQERYPDCDAARGIGSFQFSLRSLIQQELSDLHRPQIDEHLKKERPFVDMDLTTGTVAYHDAAWELVRRGVLVPAVSYQTDNTVRAIADEYRLTPFGIEWAGMLVDYDVIPSEYGRFESRLIAHQSLFGDVFLSRGREALRCYRAHLYIACSVMCGAASEAIALKLAVARTGDERHVMKEYQRSQGARNLLNILVKGQNSHIIQEMETYFDTIRYWRDPAAHADDRVFDEPYAFILLLLLLRFAEFAERRWTELTMPAA